MDDKFTAGNEKVDVWMCCGKAFLALNDIVSHYTARHPKKDLTVPVGKRLNLPQCGTCSKIFSKQRRLEKHKMRRHGQVNVVPLKKDATTLGMGYVNGSGDTDNGKTIEEEFAAEVHVNGATWGGPTSATGGNAKAELSNQEKGKSTSESDLIDFVPIMMESSISSSDDKMDTENNSLYPSIPGLSITYSRKNPQLSDIESFPQTPLRCTPNVQLRGRQQHGKVLMNKSTMFLRVLPVDKKRQKGGSSVSGTPKPSKTNSTTYSMSCPMCPSRTFRAAAGLSSHMRSKHGRVPTKKISDVSQASEEQAPSTAEVMEEVGESHLSGATPGNEEETVPNESTEEGDEDISEESGNSKPEDGCSEDEEESRTERDGDQIICKLCDERHDYRTKTHQMKFDLHMDIHYGKRPYICPHDCGASFKSAVRLLVHSSRHTQEPNFECSVCSKKFRTNTQLRAHNRFCK